MKIDTLDVNTIIAGTGQGKSHILKEIAKQSLAGGKSVLYISTEESEHRVYQTLGFNLNLLVIGVKVDSNVDEIVDYIKYMAGWNQHPDLVIYDSIINTGNSIQEIFTKLSNIQLNEKVDIWTALSSRRRIC